MHDHLQVFTAIGPGLAVAVVQGAAQLNPVTAIDIALEPDATMVQHAMDANARLRKSFPNGFALDETHHPHISMLQQFPLCWRTSPLWQRTLISRCSTMPQASCHPRG
jgi:hypothetical protein